MYSSGDKAHGDFHFNGPGSLHHGRRRSSLDAAAAAAMKTTEYGAAGEKITELDITRSSSRSSGSEFGGYGKKKTNALGISGRIPVIVTLGIVVVTACFVTAACILSALHRIREGCVGVYFKNGRLLESTSPPGLHWSQPFVTRVEQITVRPETEFMDPVVCTTRDGVKNVFRDIQIISSVDGSRVLELVRNYGVKMKNLLIFERVSEAVQVFCANHTIDEVYNTKFLEIFDYVNATLEESLGRFAPDDAIKIWNVFLPKPDVPPAIAANYRQVKVEWTRQLVAQQQQKTEKIKKETQKIKAVLDAEREKEVELIDIEKDIQREEGKKNVSSINNDIFSEKKRIEADTMSYVGAQEASTNERLLTPEYIKLNVARSVVNNTKFFFSGGDSLIGGMLADVFGTNRVKRSLGGGGTDQDIEGEVMQT